MLAQIETKDENDFLQRLLIPGWEYWIGGEDRIKEGYWVWSMTQEPFVFKAWAAGEPNNAPGDEDKVDPNHEDCLVLIGSGRWNDRNCYRPRASICERVIGSGLVG